MKKVFFLVISFLNIFLLPLNAETDTHYPTIQFFGAAQMVGGSSFLVNTGKTKILIDCGLFYGREQEKLNDKLSFDPTKLDVVLLTHAHIDHIGRVPLLYKHGYKGKIIATDATKSLAGVMLNMSMKIAKSENKVIYDLEDFSKAMQSFIEIEYGYKYKISDDVSVRFLDASHIVGSAIIEIYIKTDNKEMKLVVASDLGRPNTPILRDPEIITEADYVLIESTYGTSTKKKLNQSDFGKIISDTLKKGGSILIPAFVLDKTQKVLYILGQLKRNGVISMSTPVYLDSSTAKDINKIYKNYSKYYDEESMRLKEPISFLGLKEVNSVESIQSHKVKQPAIYVSSSGMLDHGNSPKHLEQMIEDSKNLLAIVGWQAPDSLGRKLANGEKVVNITIEEFKNGEIIKRESLKPVKLQVKQFYEFSSHADGCEILTWLSNLSSNKRVIVVHGEKEQTEKLANKINTNLGLKTYIPVLNDIYYLNPNANSYSVTKTVAPCSGLDNDNISIGAFSDQ